MAGVQKLLANTPQATTGSVELDIAHRMNLAQSQVYSLFTWGTLGAGATVHLDATPDGTNWISAAQINSANFNTVVAVQVRALKVRGRVDGGDGTTDVDMMIM